MLGFGSIVYFFLLPNVSCVVPFVLAVNVEGADDIQRIVPSKYFFTKVERC
jgi:hypothetical protein